MSNLSAKVGRHHRVEWQAKDPENILVHARFDELKGTYRKSGRDQARGQEKYDRAKKLYDLEAAIELVDELSRHEIVEELVTAVLAADKPCRVVFPHPEFDSDYPNDVDKPVTNALPFAFASHLAVELGGEIETNIIECARPGRTKLNKFPRFLWQPKFEGEIDKSCVYVIVDDNCTLGGTFAMLRSYIVENGGTVIAVCALTTPQGRTCKFGIADSTVDVLKMNYGEEISPLWKEEIGHDIRCLTENEGSFLANWEGQCAGDSQLSFVSLRDRLGKAKTQGK
ncbi:hypothetical protein BAE36_17310 [Rhizobium leguminosarum bv. trifolii]|uniref:phosphoribosyltransferase n=1 Tax=Rhizobium leguminosarum TaxID=384 RepID=UPI0008034D08|nr:phosphoribosyltransferase [Rhizobium leguminosarum]OBY05961.1 hypothetical protein BAE36_17310 [Rhizobium leguminosarum bv. trifolii]